MISEKCLSYKVFEFANKNPDKIAIITKKNSISYNDFCELINTYCDILSGNEIKKGDILGLQLNNSIDFCAVLFASACLGSAIIPFDQAAPASIVDNNLKINNIDKILSDNPEINNINENKTRKSVFPQIEGNETLLICLSSGSTGIPKLIELTQENKLERARKHIELYKISEKDVILVSTPLYHSLAERLVIMSLISGCTCVIMEDFKPYEWFNFVNGNQVTFTITDSSQLVQISQLLLSPYIPEINSLRTIVSSSSCLENHVKKELIQKLNCDLYEIYGTSETSTITNIELKNDAHSFSVGKPLDFAEIKIINKDEKEIGDILCKTDLMFSGYFKNPSLTIDSFENGFFKTGDLGRIDDDGYLYYCGRKDELIKVNGVNVYPLEIENIIRNLYGVKECAVFNYPDDVKGYVLALAIVSEPDTTMKIDDIKNYCVDNLSKVFVPEHIFLINELPKNSMNKIMKNKIYETIIKEKMSGDLIYV